MNDNIFLLIGLFVICSRILHTDGLCSFPSDLQGQWVSSNWGDLYFTSTELDSITFTKYGKRKMYCDVNFGNKYILRSDYIPVLGLNAVLMTCLNLNYVSKASFYFHILTSPLEEAANDTVKIKNPNLTPSISEICDTASVTGTHEFLVKNGSTSAATLQCPDDLLATFPDYSVDFGNGNQCVNGSYLDGCSDLTLMTFHYSLCSTTLFFSATGKLSCLYSVKSGSTSYVTLYNTDSSVDGVSSYRFTCVIFQKTNNMVYASFHPSACSSTQTPTYVFSPGGVLEMTTNMTCVPQRAASAASSDSNVVVVGVVVGLLLAIIIVIVLIILYLKKCKKNDVKTMDKSKHFTTSDISSLDTNRIMKRPSDTSAPVSYIVSKNPDVGSGIVPQMMADNDVGISRSGLLVTSLSEINEEELQYVQTLNRKRPSTAKSLSYVETDCSPKEGPLNYELGKNTQEQTEQAYVGENDRTTGKDKIMSCHNRPSSKNSIIAVSSAENPEKEVLDSSSHSHDVGNAEILHGHDDVHSSKSHSCVKSSINHDILDAKEEQVPRGTHKQLESIDLNQSVCSDNDETNMTHRLPMESATETADYGTTLPFSLRTLRKFETEDSDLTNHSIDQLVSQNTDISATAFGEIELTNDVSDATSVDSEEGASFDVWNAPFSRIYVANQASDCDRRSSVAPPDFSFKLRGSMMTTSRLTPIGSDSSSPSSLNDTLKTEG